MRFYFQSEKKCECNTGFYGLSCSTPKAPNVGLNKWYTVIQYSQAFNSRAAHVSGYFQSVNKLFVHGGEFILRKSSTVASVLSCCR